MKRLHAVFLGLFAVVVLGTGLAAELLADPEAPLLTKSMLGAGVGLVLAACAVPLGFVLYGMFKRRAVIEGAADLPPAQ